MELRAYSICRTCMEIHRSHRGCPECDGDVAEPPAPARVARADTPAAVHTPAPKWWQTQHGLAALSVTLALGALVLVVLAV